MCVHLWLRTEAAGKRDLEAKDQRGITCLGDRHHGDLVFGCLWGTTRNKDAPSSKKLFGCFGGSCESIRADVQRVPADVEEQSDVEELSVDQRVFRTVDLGRTGVHALSSNISKAFMAWCFPSLCCKPKTSLFSHMRPPISLVSATSHRCGVLRWILLVQ